MERALRAQAFEVETLANEEATRDRILDVLENDLPKRVSPDDRVVVYFAGHGITMGSDANESGYLMPTDGDPERPAATAINMG